MAITIERNIPEFNSAYNKQELAVSSEHFSIAGFNYVFRVNVEGVAGFKEFRALPEPAQDFGVKDFHNYIETFVRSALFDPNDVAAFELARTTQFPSIRRYDIDIFELWTVAGVPTLDPDGDGAVNTGQKYAWNASYPHVEWIDEQNEATPFNEWFLSPANGIAGQFLTNNREVRNRITDHGWTYLLSDTPADVDFLEIKTFDSAGSLIQTVNINNLLGAIDTNSRFLRVSTGPASLNAVTGGIVLGAQPIITAAVATYTIQCFQAGPNVISELLTFTIESACRYTPVRIHFENQFGAFDGFNFNFRNQRSERTKNKTGMFEPYNVIATGLEYKNSNRSNITLQTTTENRQKVRSEYLTEEENEWLKELIRTNEAYIEFTNKGGHTDLKPIKEIKGVWTQKVDDIDKLYTIEMDLILSWDDESQRR